MPFPSCGVFLLYLCHPALLSITRIIQLAFKSTDNGSQWCHCILTSKIVVHIYCKKDNYCCPLIKLFQLHPEELANYPPLGELRCQTPHSGKKSGPTNALEDGEMGMLGVNRAACICTLHVYALLRSTLGSYTGLSIYFPRSIKCIVTRGNFTASSGFSACQAKLADGKSN